MKNMKKMVGLIVLAMSMSVSAFAAAPAFDTPQEWLAAMQKERAERMAEDAEIHGFSENHDYYAASAFDTPQEWLAAMQKEQAAGLAEDAALRGYSENHDYTAVPAFDMPQEWLAALK